MKNELPPDLGTAHHYGQYCEHSEAYIVANKQALLDLKRAIEEALEFGDGQTEFWSSDGEGYTTHIIKLDDSDKWNQLLRPYTYEFSQDVRKDALKPWDLTKDK